MTRQRMKVSRRLKAALDEVLEHLYRTRRIRTRKARRERKRERFYYVVGYRYVLLFTGDCSGKPIFVTSNGTAYESRDRKWGQIGNIIKLVSMKGWKQRPRSRRSEGWKIASMEPPK